MALSSLPEDPELPEELPPLEPDEGDGELEAQIDLTDFVESFDPTPDVDLDHEDALDLDVGVSVDEPEADDTSDERGELVLDIAELLAFAEEEPPHDDALGPTDFEPSADVEELAEGGADADESSEPDYEGLVPEELPSLDADEDGDFSPDEAWVVAEHALDEPLPPRAAKQWTARSLITDDVDALVVDRGLIVAAGATIHCLGRDARAIVPRAPVTSATLVGGLLVYFTAAGQLVRQELWQPSSERVEGWREAAGARQNAPVTLELGGGGLEPGVVLARTSTGRLLRSRDRGASFDAEDLHARVLALDARSETAVALAETSAGRSLIVSAEGGSAWQAVPLDDTAARVADGANPLLASHGDVIAIADPERGIAVSQSSGKRFARVATGGLATALAAGSLDAEACVFAALYRETEDKSFIVRIDAAGGRAEVVAELGAERHEDGIEGARVTALAWDGPGRRLLAAGSFGLIELTP